MGKDDEAEAMLRDVLKLGEVLCLGNLAVVLDSKGKYDEPARVRE